MPRLSLITACFGSDSKVSDPHPPNRCSKVNEAGRLKRNSAIPTGACPRDIEKHTRVGLRPQTWQTDWPLQHSLNPSTASSEDSKKHTRVKAPRVGATHLRAHDPETIEVQQKRTRVSALREDDTHLRAGDPETIEVQQQEGSTQTTLTFEVHELRRINQALEAELEAEKKETARLYYENSAQGRQFAACQELINEQQGRMQELRSQHAGLMREMQEDRAQDMRKLWAQHRDEIMRQRKEGVKGFLDLPAELRNRIYELMVADEDWGSGLGLVLVNHQVREEYLSIL